MTDESSRSGDKPGAVPVSTPDIDADAAARTDDGLGIAGGMAKSFVHSPLSLLLFIAMLAMGVLGLQMTPRQEDPQISVPMVDLMLHFPGASAEQVSNLAIEPLERLMSEIPGVKHVYSASKRENGLVTVQFKVGEQMGPSLVKVHDKLQSNMDRIPPGVQPPIVKAVGIDDVPVVTLTLWSDEASDADLRRLALDILQDVSRDTDVGRGFVVGGRHQEMRIEVSPELLSGNDVTLDQIEQTIRAANNERSVGESESADRHYSVVAGRYLRSETDINELELQRPDGSELPLSAVTTSVSKQPEEFKNLVNYYTGAAYGVGEGQTAGLRADGAAAVTIAIAKKIGTNGVTVAENIIGRVQEKMGRDIPDQVHVEVTRNYGASADQKVDELIFKLFIATGAVTVLVLLALGLRPAIIVTMVIPVVLLMTVFGAWIGGFTIDRVSLFALIFSIGILVDDAIVVVENIYRRWLANGRIDTATAVDAVREVGNPTIIATLTVVAALLPMGMVRGMMGPYMSPIPALGSVAMLISLFAAFVFVPWLAMRLKPSMGYLEKAATREHREEAWLDRFFRKTLGPLLDSRKKGWMFLGTLVMLFFATMLLFQFNAVRVKMLPFDNKPEYSVVVDMPEGTSVGVTANVTRQIAEALRVEPEVTAIQTYAGIAKPFDFNGMVRHTYLRQSPWQGEIQVQLVDKGERQATSHDIAVRARETLQRMQQEGAESAIGQAQLTVVEMPPGPPVLQTVVAEVYGPDEQTRRDFARDLEGMFEESESLADVDTYIADAYQYWRFHVNTKKSTSYGINVDSIIRAVDQAMGGYRIGDIKEEGLREPTWIVLQVPLASRADVERLSVLPIPGSQGATVPLSELGEFVLVDEDPVIYHKDLRPVEYVVADAVGRLGAPIYPMMEIERRLERYTAPDGVKVSGMFLGPPADSGTSAFEWTGEWTVTYETFRDMGMAFGAALILIYILVVWEFGNFVVPGIIMAPIPLTLLGIIPGHWLMDAEFTATSMIGFIALAGIIVRNSILLVDFAIEAMEHQRLDVREAVLQACKARTRPIMITAFALVAGSAVILSDPIFQGMAVSLLFGVMVSTVLTLVVIPLGCISAGKYLVRG